MPAAKLKRANCRYDYGLSSIIRASATAAANPSDSSERNMANRRIIPNGKGIYGWWFNAMLPDVELAGTIEVAG